MKEYGNKTGRDLVKALREEGNVQIRVFAYALEEFELLYKEVLTDEDISQYNDLADSYVSDEKLRNLVKITGQRR